MATARVLPAIDCNFQEIILKRKAERQEYLKKKKEKWEQNLNRIEEMKSMNGIHPLALFPKEIWMEIMDKFNPKDRWNMYQIHPIFSGLLESNKIRDILFPQALTVIMNQIRNDQDYSLDFDGDDIFKSDLVPLIKLRGVCKSLRDAIDQWFENEHLRMLPNHQLPDPEENSYDWRDEEDRERLTSITFEMCPKEESAATRRARLKGLIENFRVAEPDEDDSENGINCHTRARNFFLKSIQVEISSRHTVVKIMKKIFTSLSNAKLNICCRAEKGASDGTLFVAFSCEWREL